LAASTGPCAPPATQLARSGIPFEEVAELLWNGELGAPGLRWPRYAQADRLRWFAASIVAPASNDQLMELFALFTMQLGLSRGNATGQPDSGDTPAAARELIQTMAGCFGYASQRRTFYQLRKGQSIVEVLLGALEIADSAENHAGLCGAGGAVRP
jgi:citrate synthase